MTNDDDEIIEELKVNEKKQKKQQQPVEKLLISRPGQLSNGLNQPPKKERTFSIVIYFAACYVLVYFLMGITMNIILFVSKDFTTLTGNDTDCG